MKSLRRNIDLLFDSRVKIKRKNIYEFLILYSVYMPPTLPASIIIRMSLFVYITLNIDELYEISPIMNIIYRI